MQDFINDLEKELTILKEQQVCSKTRLSGAEDFENIGSILYECKQIEIIQDKIKMHEAALLRKEDEQSLFVYCMTVVLQELYQDSSNNTPSAQISRVWFNKLLTIAAQKM